MSDAEQNVALVRRFYDEVLNQKQLDRLEEFVSPEMVDTNPGADAAAGGNRPPGIDQLRMWWGMVFNAFPDSTVEFQVVFGEDDKVIENSRITGKHAGQWLAFPPTGKDVTFEMTNMYRIADGKIVERWGAYDMPSIMGQVGAPGGPPGGPG